MKLVVVKQHFDIMPGTVIEDLGPCQADTNLFGEPYLTAQHPKGFKLTIPYSKVLQEDQSPFETINS